MLVETHAHLDYPDFAADVDNVLRRANEAGELHLGVFRGGLTWASTVIEW
jgi:Tat protein secretion system quality control protein TatD with DNase activity